MERRIAIRVWDDRDPESGRRFRVALPDGRRSPGGMRLGELRARAGADGTIEIPSPFAEERARIPLAHWADDDPEHTLLAVGFQSSERRGPPPDAKVWRPPPPPPDLQALLDELHALQAQFRDGDESERARLVPLIEAGWERVEAHPAHTGWRERRDDYVEIAPGIHVWDTRRAPA